MEIFIRKPSVELYPGVTVYADTVLDFENEKVKQHVENLVLHTVATVEGDNFKSVCDTVIQLDEGDVLIFESEERGYIKPVERFESIPDAIAELEAIRDLG